MTKPYNKGDELTLEVDRLAFGGRGVARIEGFVVFVDRALPGQTVRAKLTKVKKRYGEADTVAVESETPHAVPPSCVHFGKCGGCLHQDLDYAQQLHWKTEHVRDALSRLGGAEAPVVHPAVASPEIQGFRNKMEFAFSGSGKSLSLGLHRRGSETIVNVEHCTLQSQLCMDIVREAREFCRQTSIPAYDPRTRMGLWRFLVVRETKATMQCLVHLITSPAADGGAARSLCEHLLGRFSALSGAVHSTRKNRIGIAQAERTVNAYGTGSIEEHLLGLRYRIGADAFFQTNSRAAEILYRTARDMAGLNGTQTVLDLYCGVGGLALAMASGAAHVMGVENHEGAVRDAKANARLNNIDNCEFVVADVLDHLKELKDAPDVVVIDPPRSGMHPDAVAALAKLGPKRIIYVSCNPTTLARDAALMGEDYKVTEARPVDLFPHGPHIEAVVSLERLK